MRLWNVSDDIIIITRFSFLSSPCRCSRVSLPPSPSSHISAKHLNEKEQLFSMAGSFGYVAPEVLTKKGHGKAVDMWSTGCVFFVDTASQYRLLTITRSFCEYVGLSHTSFCAAIRLSGLKILRRWSERRRRQK